MKSDAQINFATTSSSNLVIDVAALNTAAPVAEVNVVLDQSDDAGAATTDSPAGAALCVSALHALDAAFEPPVKEHVFEGERIVFRAGAAEIILDKSRDGVIEIHADAILLRGRNIVSEAEQESVTRGETVISQAAGDHRSEGRYVKIQGDLVAIN